MIKKILLITIPIILLVSHGGKKFYNWRQTRKELAEMEQEITKLQKENKELIEKKDYLQTKDFIKREAREKLGLTEEEETTFVLPELPDLSLLQLKGEKYQHLAPDQQWWQLFFQ